MRKLSKRLRAARGLVEKKLYTMPAAMAILKTFPPAKFVESVDVALKLGVDPRKSDQTVRGAVVLPEGTGRVNRVAVFAEGEQATLAQQAGADIVGLQDLFDAISSGDCPFDTVIAHTKHMGLVGKLGPILGPKGLMPNPKLGTVTTDVAKAVKDAKNGQIQYRNDKNGIIHSSIGRIDFSVNALITNLRALLLALQKAKPASTKGTYLQALHISTTMGPSIAISLVGEV